MAIRNCAAAAADRLIGFGSAAGRRRKLPQAKIAVAASTSQGKRRAKKLAGVASSRNAQTTPPARLTANSARNDSRSAPETSRRPARPVVTWPGKRAMVEVMLAARASMPERISAGSVTNEPPPASAFCTPAQSPAASSSHHIRVAYGPAARQRQSGGASEIGGVGVEAALAGALAVAPASSPSRPAGAREAEWESAASAARDRSSRQALPERGPHPVRESGVLPRAGRILTSSPRLIDAAAWNKLSR